MPNPKGANVCFINATGAFLAAVLGPLAPSANRLVEVARDLNFNGKVTTVPNRGERDCVSDPRRRQEDAAEFLGAVIDLLPAPTAARFAITQKITTVVRCDRCEATISVAEVHENMVKVPAHQELDVDEEINDILCDKCGGHEQLTQRTSHTAKDVMIAHIKRFNNAGQKLSTKRNIGPIFLIVLNQIKSNQIKKEKSLCQL